MHQKYISYARITGGNGGHWYIELLARNGIASPLYSLTNLVHNHLVGIGLIKEDSSIPTCKQAFLRETAINSLIATIVYEANKFDTEQVC